MQILSADEITKAYERWKKVYQPPEGKKHGMCPMWKHFLGARGSFMHTDDNNLYKVPDGPAHKIRLINGPHGETLLKAWRIQCSG